MEDLQVKARAILITGVPGSGKSTLARELARELRVPYLARDDVRGGLFLSAGAWNDAMVRLPSSQEADRHFLDLVESMLRAGVSCVIEYVFRSRRPRELERVLSCGECVVIQTSAAQSLKRFIERNHADRLMSNTALLNAAGFDSVQQQTETAGLRMRQIGKEMMTQFPIPSLEVDCSDGYQPGIDRIVEFATTRESGSNHE